MEIISSFGTKIQILASQTFPFGFTVTQASDDQDFFDFPSIVMKDKAMGGNGDLVMWSKAVPLEIKISVIAGSVNDNFLSAIANANVVGKDKSETFDIITMSVFFPNSRILSFQKGGMTEAALGFSTSSEGRFKSKEYSFAFESQNLI